MNQRSSETKSTCVSLCRARAREPVLELSVVAERPAEVGLGLHLVVRAVVEDDLAQLVGGRPLGDQIDQAAGLILAVEHRARPLDDVDLLQHVGVDLARDLAALPARVVAVEAVGGLVEAADVDPVETRLGAEGVDVDARRVADRRGDRLDVARRHLVGGDDRNRLRDLDQRRVGLGRRRRGGGDEAAGLRDRDDAAEGADLQREVERGSGRGVELDRRGRGLEARGLGLQDVRPGRGRDAVGAVTDRACVLAEVPTAQGQTRADERRSGRVDDPAGDLGPWRRRVVDAAGRGREPCAPAIAVVATMRVRATESRIAGSFLPRKASVRSDGRHAGIHDWYPASTRFHRLNGSRQARVGPASLDPCMGSILVLYVVHDRSHNHAPCSSDPAGSHGRSRPPTRLVDDHPWALLVNSGDDGPARHQPAVAARPVARRARRPARPSGPRQRACARAVRDADTDAGDLSRPRRATSRRPGTLIGRCRAPTTTPRCTATVASGSSPTDELERTLETPQRQDGESDTGRLADGRDPALRDHPPAARTSSASRSSIERFEAKFKLGQDEPLRDALAVADHLARLPRSAKHRALAAAIRRENSGRSEGDGA